MPLRIIKFAIDSELNVPRYRKDESVGTREKHGGNFDVVALKIHDRTSTGRHRAQKSTERDGKTKNAKCDATNENNVKIAKQIASAAHFSDAI